MLTLFITVITLLVAAARAHENMTLPQCGNLTLTWAQAASPYTINIIDQNNGHSLILHRKSNHLHWPIDALVGAELYFLVTDSADDTDGGGPYKVVEGDSSCLDGKSIRRDEAPRVQPELKRTGITLHPLSGRDAWGFTNGHGDKRSHVHGRRRRSGI